MDDDRLRLLAERCEAASGPDRELDALIWCHLNGMRYIAHFPAYSDPTLTQVEFKRPRSRTSEVTTGRVFDHAVPYTAFVDFAAKLAPEGWDWEAGSLGEDGSYASVWKHGWRDDTVIHAERSVATAALALTAAALRARSVQS